ncbi:MAG: hypothetical protein JXA18_05705 [Chitinispirillaceae bacterium]|nr:hypothetical protein [Chitinispirillaceae bacterium]
MIALKTAVAVQYGAIALMIAAVDSPSAVPLSELQRKHATTTESWSLYTKVKSRSGNEQYIALFFLCGKFMLFSGNYIHYSRLTLPSKEYCHESSTIIPPFGTIEHDYSALNEKIGGNAITAETTSSRISITADFSRLKGSFYLSQKKQQVTFRDVLKSDYDKRRFDWYILPRCGVTMYTAGANPDTLFGNGHFHQFWGKGGESNCDWIVAHTESGYDMIIANFPEEKQHLSWLPGNYIMVSRPDGSLKKITRFKLTLHRWWKSELSNNKYPLSYTVVAPHYPMTLAITAFKKNQIKKISGKEYWYGFGSVTGTIHDEPQHGWAYISPLGAAD